jgi:hypothetical protein
VLVLDALPGTRRTHVLRNLFLRHLGLTMNARLDRSNLYPGKCDVCGVAVSAQRGYIIPRDAFGGPTPKHARKWCTICRAVQCATTAVGQAAVESANARELRADGAIVMPYEESALPLLRAIATFDGDAKCWRASPLLRDRDLVLSIADKLGLAVDESLRIYEDPPHVRAAVKRARAVSTIREYQVEGVRWLAYRGDVSGAPEGFVDKRPGSLLSDSPGLGKTAQTLLQLADDEALVVVCPANAKAVWPREAEKWRPGRFDVVTICEGTESFKWPDNPRELVVINYDVLPFTPAQISEEREETEAKLAALGEAVDGEDVKVTRKRKRLTKLLTTNAARRPAGEPSCKVLVVEDEAHYVENNKALRTVRARHLGSKATRLIGLTGTPVESEPLKLWGLLTTLRCNPFTWTSFLTQFNGSAGRWGGYEFERVAPRPGSTGRGPVKVEPGTTEILARCMLRRTKDQVLTELPPKVYSEIPVALSEKLIRELDEISAEHIDAILSGALPPFEAMSSVRKALAQACIPTMLEIVESYETAGIPLGVFSAHRGPVEALADRKGWHTITGDTSSKKRGEIQDAFQAGEGLGVAGTRAMAEAMTLTRAATVLFVDRFWERKHNEQAEDRFHRIGQHDSVNVITLVPDHPLTQHVAELLGAKYAFVDAVLHGEQSCEAPAGSRFDAVDDAEWKARVDAKVRAEQSREAVDKQREQARRERELAKIAEREVSPKVSEQRATLRAQRLGINVDRYAHIPVDVVRDALAYMLARCDGAVEKDDEGFNKPDGCVARWLCPGVAAGSQYAVASMAVILRHYPRQLAEVFPALFDEPKTVLSESTHSCVADLK